VVITHKAYELALDKLGKTGTIRQTWSFFHKWRKELAGFWCIDECFNMLLENQIDLEMLARTLKFVPESVWKEYKREYEALNLVKELPGTSRTLSVNQVGVP